MISDSGTPGPNNHIYDYLRYYCSPESNFDYAVLLIGSWGAGKTHLIESFMNEREQDPELKTLYVSLYGLTSLSQIDDAFYRQLHPVLSHKGMKIAASVAKSLFKIATKVDIDGDGKEDLTISSSIPDLKIQEHFAKPERCMLVFDDLERSAMNVPDVLGYINSFVEHEGLKTLIVANEDAIINKYGAEYTNIKEKLIGQTIEVTSDVEAAITDFVGSVRHEKTREFIKKNLKKVIEIHDQSKGNNLRALKHALWDFEKLSKSFQDAHWEKDDPIEYIMRATIMLSIEYRLGRISESDFIHITENPVLRHMRKRSEEHTSVADRMDEQYPGVELGQEIFDLNIIKDILFRGWATPQVVQDSLNMSSYYASPGSLPAWRVAWNGWRISDDEFENAVSTVEKQFAAREFEENGELLHVFGLRLMFSDIGAINVTRDEVVNQCKLYVDDISASGKISNRVDGTVGLDHSESFFGLSIAELETQSFKEILSYYLSASDFALEKQLPDRAKKLIAIMREDTDKFYRLLCSNNIENSLYDEIPVLAAIEPKTFVKELISLSPEQQRSVFITLGSRYKHNKLDGSLRKEQKWLEETRNILASATSTMRPMSKKRLVTRIESNISPLLSKTNLK